MISWLLLPGCRTEQTAVVPWCFVAASNSLLWQWVLGSGGRPVAGQHAAWAQGVLGPAQVEEHMVDGVAKRLLVHRKGATRAFPPHHPLIPVDYQLTGQPVLIGGTMGTHSYVLTGA